MTLARWLGNPARLDDALAPALMRDGADASAMTN
jgi:hypothetical protein